jgi:hypothetical protein
LTGYEQLPDRKKDRLACSPKPGPHNNRRHRASCVWLGIVHIPRPASGWINSVRGGPAVPRGDLRVDLSPLSARLFVSSSGRSPVLASAGTFFTAQPGRSRGYAEQLVRRSSPTRRCFRLSTDLLSPRRRPIRRAKPIRLHVYLDSIPTVVVQATRHFWKIVNGR